MLMRLCLLALVAAIFTSGSNAQQVDENSYICLASDHSKCFGVSPGQDSDGNWISGYSGLYIQLKNRLTNEEKGTDFHKMRWHIDYERKWAYLSASDPPLCITRKDFGQHIDNLFLRQCEEGNPLQEFTFDSLARSGADSSVKIRSEGDTSLCIGVLACNRAGGAYCQRHEEELEAGVFELGAYLKAVPCSQVPATHGFTNEVDCAIDCTLGLLGNGVCDQGCANDACLWDGGECATLSPTNPTFAPTAIPTATPTPAPTAIPTTGTPSTSPTPKPTFPPTLEPTAVPTTPIPTAVPTTGAPTAVPTAEQLNKGVEGILGDEDGDGSNGAVIAVGVAIGVLVIAGGTYYAYKKSENPETEANEYKGAVPESPGPEGLDGGVENV